jgi:hypothetical protein
VEGLGWTKKNLTKKVLAPVLRSGLVRRLAPTRDTINRVLVFRDIVSRAALVMGVVSRAALVRGVISRAAHSRDMARNRF